MQMIKVSIFYKDFQNVGSKQNEKYPASVEVLNEKQAAEYLTQCERHLTWLNIPEVCLEKPLEVA